jgi:hypothetical protein
LCCYPPVQVSVGAPEQSIVRGVTHPEALTAVTARMSARTILLLKRDMT